MSFDEAVLDDPDALAARDGTGLLWTLATAGAQVRRAVETVGEFGVGELNSDDAPRSLLVATDATSSGSARLLTRLGSARAPALVWHGVALPRWAGPADALVVGSVDGRHPRLAQLVADGARRGLAMAVVAPRGSQVAVAAGRAPVHELPGGLHPRAARWSVLTPLLQALDALGLYRLPLEVLAEIATALDEQAAACRPDAESFVNPAKALAAEFAEGQPVIAGAGALAGVAARTVADALHQLAGAPAVPVTLPDGVARAGALLQAAGAGAPGEAVDDFFRDRVEDAASRRPRLVVIGDDGVAEDPLLGERSADEIQLDEVAARRAADALHRLARELGLRSSSVEVPAGDPLARFAAATAFGDFTAAYLGFGQGIDAGAAGPVELPH